MAAPRSLYPSCHPDRKPNDLSEAKGGEVSGGISRIRPVEMRRQGVLLKLFHDCVAQPPSAVSLVVTFQFSSVFLRVLCGEKGFAFPRLGETAEIANDQRRQARREDS